MPRRSQPGRGFPRRRKQPFSLDLTFPDPVRQTLFNLVAPAIEHMFALSDLNASYDAVASQTDDRSFAQKALDHLNIRYHVSPEDLARIPKTGPVITVSNHPFGGLDGIILCAILRRIRPDAKVMANYLLSRIPDLRDMFFFVDPFGGKDAARNNLKAIRQSIEHVQNGGLLSIFPSGEVSHIDLGKRAVIDPKWSDTVARIVRRTGAPVLPVYFAGGNSPLFQILGVVHPLLRTAMLPRELLKKKKTTVSVHIGTLIAAKKLASFEADEDVTAYMRLRTYILQSREPEPKKPTPPQLPFMPRPRPTEAEPIVPARDPALLAGEIAGLPADCLLLDHNEYAVYAAHAAQIPHTLHEIGRLREITFRGVHEGTGKAIDLDRFDEYYTHLFLWHKASAQVAGGYRIGLTDDILRRSGVVDVYTSHYFQFPRSFLDRLGPALELGRSFVRTEYQRSYSPLLLLWKGIGQFVVRHPQYQVLFGPVSINNKYQSLSRQLIMSFLDATSSASSLRSLIHAKNPPRIRPTPTVDLRECSTVVRDIDEVSDLVAEIESDQKGIPILLKQYMKLGAKILGFNIDPDFGECLDGLVLVDLRHTDPRLIERFATAEGARVILQYQKNNPVR